MTATSHDVDAERERIAQADARIAAAQARVAQLGGALHIVGGAGGRPSFLACHGVFVRDLADIEAAEAWLDAVEARSRS